MKNKLRKLSLSLLLTVFVFVSVFGFLFSASPAKAIPVEIIADAPSTFSKITDKIQAGFKSALINMVVQSAAYFMRRVAYDSAVWLASGGKGQTPFSHTTGFGDYIKSVGDEAVGVAIEEMGKPFGLNLCKIPNVKIDLAIRIGLNYNFGAVPLRRPNCTLTKFRESWTAQAFNSQYGGLLKGDPSQIFNSSFAIDQSDLGVYMGAKEQIDNNVAAQRTAAILQRQEGNGIKPVTKPVSGQIVTPAVAVGQEVKNQAPSEKQKQAEAGFWATVGTDSMSAVGSASALFLSTLAGTMLKNFQEKGMLPFGVGCVGDKCPKNTAAVSDLAAQYEGLLTPMGGATGNREAAQILFGELLTPQLSEIDRYNVMANFTDCPDNPSINNCVADENMAAATQEAVNGKPVTIAEAIAKNWLHGEWRFVPPNEELREKNCYQSKYCYSNIKKLRLARVLPLGFEIAAQNSNPDKPWTLKQVVDGFNDCNFNKDTAGNIVGINNDPINKPFCRLIDPNWVIKAPASKCNSLAYGPSVLTSGGASRQQDCVDLSTCVAYDKDGNCVSQGYCTREKNVWKIDANKCDSQYRTCRAFTDASGNAVGYLYRTLDTGFCTQDNVGCSAYSLTQDAAGKWASYNNKDYINNVGENSTVHFNNKISTECSAGSDGCSAFSVASSTGVSVYLRKAPAYLGCYDSNPSNGPVVDWPQTQSDLSKIVGKAECSNYSMACIADEVNCNWYNPITYTGDRIPGRYTPANLDTNGQVVWNDQCDKKCAGYAAYREMAGNYSGGSAVEYIIPSSGNTCGADEESCSSFTNLNTAIGGVENVEYYSYLRPCILPDVNQQKNFFTYEGSTVGGYQLKSFTLVKDTNGSPKYFYRTPADVADYDSICTEALYKAGLASLDCRQFNDEQGAVYYKLLSKTIVVSDKCTPYRLNNNEMFTLNSITSQNSCDIAKGYWYDNKCDVCFSNGEYRAGSCYYNGLAAGVANNAGSSQSCSAAANTCRAFKGNAGNNVKNIFSDNFEGVANITNINWNNANISNESTHAGEHSLAGQNDVYKTVSLTPGKSYDLTFWAKGSASANVVIRFNNNGALSSFDTISVGDLWKSYHLGPIELQGSVTSTELHFVGSNFFLDNVSLKEIADYTYLVKDSLKVDPICDSNVDDNLPGEALGCAEYKNPDDTSVYLTGFSYLCREGAIGCTALFDTKNTMDTAGPRVYNVWFAGTAGVTVSKTISGNTYSCQIPKGQNGCYVNIFGESITTITTLNPNEVKITTSSIYIASDTPATAPIYLAVNKEATCNQVDLGCTKAGLKKDTVAGSVYQDVIIKNDPAAYDSTLCQNEAVGCNAYSYNDGAMYFKDPSVIGQKICSYRVNVDKNGTKYNGWFWKGVGKCAAGGKYCSGDNDCGVNVKCEGIDLQPCYPNYLQAGNEYGLWSYGNIGDYQNFVGTCPAEQSGCTQFTDHNDNDKSYYLIDGDSLKNSKSACNGAVSEKEGCVLFDNVDNANKFWSTSETYKLSQQKNNISVSPVAAPAGDNHIFNDANIILKVTRDRECGEWLQCITGHKQYVESKNQWETVCDDIGRCNKAPTTLADVKTNICLNWVDGISGTSNQILNDNFYRNRDVSWAGMDFSGYSILGMYPIEELDQWQTNAAQQEDETGWRLVKKIPCGSNCASTDTNSPACENDGQACGFNSSGVCINGACVQDLQGNKNNITQTAPAHACRAYPEQDSPFSSAPVIKSNQLYANANLCSDPANPLGCECDYIKNEYSSVQVPKYVHDNAAPLQVCVGGINDGKICNDSGGAGTIKKVNCEAQTSGGACQEPTKTTPFIGWRGFCLEKDLSRVINANKDDHPCLTWLPVDNLFGAPDINNQHPDAGYVGNPLYCAAAAGNLNSGHYTKGVNFSSSNNLNSLKLQETRGAGELTKNRHKITGTVMPSSQYYKDEIDYIKIVVTDGVPANSAGSDWFNHAENKNTFFIRNMAVTKYDKDNHTPTISNDGTEANYDGWSSTNAPYQRALASGLGDDWTLRYDRGSKPMHYTVDLEGVYREVKADFAYNDADTKEHAQYIDLCDDNGCDGTHTDMHIDDFTTTKGLQKYDAGCVVQVHFNSATKKMERVDLVCYRYQAWDYNAPPPGQAGGITEESKASVSIAVSVGLREPCLQIAETGTISSNDTVGWTDRLWQQNKTFKIPVAQYKNSTMASPYGSIRRITSFGSKTSWTDILQSFYTHFTADHPNDNMPPVVSEGRPYSCNSACLDLETSSGTNLRSSILSAYSTPLATAIKFATNSLSNIFAVINTGWTWNGSNYVLNDKTFPYAYNTTETSTARAPQVHPVGECLEGDKCIEENNNGITVNNKNSGNVYVDGSRVFLSFFAYAANNQMPIKKVKVDWGDGSSAPPISGSIRNRRGLTNSTCNIPSGQTQGSCVSNALVDPDPVVGAWTSVIGGIPNCNSDADCTPTDKCVPESSAPHFGYIAGQTCDNTPFSFDHTYQCTEDSDTYQSTGCPTAGGNYPNGCCVYVPHVQVVDNWGYCNGTCGDANSPGGTRCYNASWKTIPKNECDTWFNNNTNHFEASTGFNGSIIVAAQ